MALLSIFSVWFWAVLGCFVVAAGSPFAPSRPEMLRAQGAGRFACRRGLARDGPVLRSALALGLDRAGDCR
jgi:hypothetical protein